MFGSIAIGPTGLPYAKIDAGFLAECLVFYQKVRVVTAADTLKTLVRTAGAAELLDLCDMGVLSIEFLDNLTAVISVESSVGQCHDYGMVEAHVTRFPQVARKIAQEEAGTSGRGLNALWKRLKRTVVRSQYTKEIIKESQENLTNRTYLEESVRHVLGAFVPAYPIPHDLYFRPKRIQGKGIHYDTNIDFSYANRLYREKVPPEHSSLTPAYLLAQISSAGPDIAIASRDVSEVAVDALKSKIVGSRFSDLLRRASQNRDKLDAFREVVVDGSRSVREVVNAGERSFRDVIKLVERAQNFRNWVAKKDDDDDLRNEYCKELSRIEWADRLPPKSLRFLVMTGMGALAGFAANPPAAVGASLALSAADYFLIDRILKGWKPNQFIEGPLRRFVG